MKKSLYLCMLLLFVVGCSSVDFDLNQDWRKLTIKKMSTPSHDTFYSTNEYTRDKNHLVLQHRTFGVAGSSDEWYQYSNSLYNYDKDSNKVHYVLTKDGEGMDELYTLENGLDQYTATRYKSFGSDDFSIYNIRYQTINGKPYIAEIVELEPQGTSGQYQEFYRTNFNYKNFLDGRITIKLYLQGKLIATDELKIAFHKLLNFPDVLLENVHPLRRHMPFMMSGHMGTFDYYITEYKSGMDRTLLTADYKFNKAGIPTSMTLDGRYLEFDRPYTHFYEFIFK